MSTTFRRRIPQQGSINQIRASSGSEVSAANKFSSSVLQYLGTKPWTGGIQLTSTGLRELDSLLTGGGQALHSCILFIKEERFTDLTDILERYWVAQGISHGQKIILVPTDSLCASDERYHGGVSADELKQQFITSLPKNMHQAKLDKAQSTKVQDSNRLNGDTILEEDYENSDNDDTADDDLKIAWQYRRDIQNERRRISSSPKVRSSNTISEFCHSFDLAGNIQDTLYQVLPNGKVHTGNDSNTDKAHIFIFPTDDTENFKDPIRLFGKLMTFLKEVIKCPYLPRDCVARVLLCDVDPIVFSKVIPLLMSRVRATQLPVCFMCTVRPSIWSEDEKSINAIAYLRRSCDIVFSVDSFCSYGDPPGEFRDLAGILEIHKLGGLHLGQISDKFAPANRYGLKRDRRKLHIQMLHLPPEDFAMGGSSVGSGVRSGGGTTTSNNMKKIEQNHTCSSSASGLPSSSVLDF